MRAEHERHCCEKLGCDSIIGPKLIDANHPRSQRTTPETNHFAFFHAASVLLRPRPHLHHTGAPQTTDEDHKVAIEEFARNSMMLGSSFFLYGRTA